MHTDSEFWLSLALQPGLGPARIRQLHARLQAAGSSEQLRAAALTATLPPPQLALVQAAARRELESDLRQQLEQTLCWAEAPGHHLLTIASPDYPPLLYQLADPPPVLFVLGQPEVLQLPQLALVGSRSPTADGIRHAGRFARELARIGYLISSGMALGIDGASHKAALEAGGRTVAVLGTGLNDIYPRQHRKLARQIAESGAVISEFLPDEGAAPWHFPQRNRIISGLSHGVLVIEAALRSGSLITARLAAEQGREVFALPGSINNPLARGCHQLLRQGAKLVECVDDILEELPGLLHWEQTRLPEIMLPVPECSEDLGQHLLQHLAYDPLSVDALGLRSGLAAADLQAQLAALELAGLVALQSGGYVRLR